MKPIVKRILMGGFYFLLIIIAVKLGIGWAFYTPSNNFDTTTETTSTTESPPSVTETTQSIETTQSMDVAQSDNPYDVYFHPTPCSTSRPNVHSNLNIKDKQSDSDISEIRRRATEIAGNDYYQQNKLFGKAILQYAAQKSIEALAEKNEKADTISKLYRMEHETLQGIITASQQKCPNDFAGQLDEIGIQMDAYAGY